MKVISITTILLIILLTACNSTKQTINYNNVVNGIDLEKIELISFDSFFNQWVFNRKIQKVDLNIKELNNDNQFTYFGKPKHGLTKIKWTFFKVYIDSLLLRFPNYNEFYGSELSDYLWTNVIPKEDIELWNEKRENQQNGMKCPYKKNRPIQNFILMDNRVRIIMTWDIKCKDLERLKGKTYSAYYYLLTREYKIE